MTSNESEAEWEAEEGWHYCWFPPPQCKVVVERPFEPELYPAVSQLLWEQLALVDDRVELPKELDWTRVATPSEPSWQHNS